MGGCEGDLVYSLIWLTPVSCASCVSVETPLEQTIPQDVTQAEQTVVPDQTTLVPNEAEAFALEPLDVTSIGESLFKTNGLPVVHGE